MRIISANVNGIRSAASKGFFEWMVAQSADVVCLQETRAQLAQLTDAVFHPAGFTSVFVEAQKKGYAGVAIYYRKPPLAIHTSFGYPLADNEGRFVQIDYEKVSIASVYLPSGTTGDVRQAEKMAFLQAFSPYLRTCAKTRRPHIFCGDVNIAHKQIDIKNWRANQTHSGFLPEERGWLDTVFGEMGYADAFRVIDPRPEQYTWWSSRGQAYAKNVGWRIDYQIISEFLVPFVRTALIYKAQRFSDHAPLVVDYAYEFEKILST